jgi:nitrogen fixation/metabolism regulation signal transduction histidine kinase
MRGDSTYFERMISNIINNDIEAVEGKKAEIEIRYEEKGRRTRNKGEG